MCLYKVDKERKRRENRDNCPPQRLKTKEIKTTTLSGAENPKSNGQNWAFNQATERERVASSPRLLQCIQPPHTAPQPVKFHHASL